MRACSLRCVRVLLVSTPIVRCEKASGRESMCVCACVLMNGTAMSGCAGGCASTQVCRVPIILMAFLSRMHAMLHAPHAPAVAAEEDGNASQESSSPAASDAQRSCFSLT